ncbi:MAG TPA: FAD-dependent monooxygenase [Bradyrhizobium sp.]|jgi:2-polyprenyl-6-methoxyphenol hydroxylase-like FAD-dependent oxidoreductase|uniref:FAD-dependent monooxygenase n=1 Tax=Bradyrhizobium sp. TaxID=376 RepID=UPI002B472696|nr:FAD-dependent monooxygenase [Bradyrhizobium sp.]HKO69305.1 FAD-dependent monooxygenase [Bradyrhizobium sp.]
MVEPDRTLIAGGGIAGLTLATALHAQGFQVDLIERNSIWQALGAGMAIQPNAMRALRALHLDCAVADRGIALHQWAFCDRQGELLCEIDLQDFWNGVGPFIGIERAKLQQALLTGVTALPCRLGISVTALLQDHDGVSICFSDGSSGRYDLVVGADGISSGIRELAFGANPPVGAGHIAWRSVVPMRPTKLSDLRFFFGDRCFFGLCPVGGGHTYGFGHVAEPRFHDDVRGRLARLRRRFDGFAEPVQEFLAALECDEQVHCSTVEWVNQEEWHRGRVVLIGDAAHASSPMMGQGGGMAVEDAYVLTECLRSAETVELALDRYVSRRKPRVRWVQQESLSVSQIIGLPPESRNAALRTRGEEMFRHRFQPLIAAP